MENVIRAIEEMKDYHDSTCGDKYASSDMDTMNLIMSDTHGKSINIFNAYKYLSRYSTSGYDKSERRIDVIKAIHYLLFELARTEESQTEITTFTPNSGSWTFTPINTTCVMCGGTGWSSISTVGQCLNCSGTGVVSTFSSSDTVRVNMESDPTISQRDNG